MLHQKVKKLLKKHHMCLNSQWCKFKSMHSYFESEESKYQNKNHMVTKLELQLYKVNGSNNEYTNFSLITDKDTNSQLSKNIKSHQLWHCTSYKNICTFIWQPVDWLVKKIPYMKPQIRLVDLSMR